MCPYYFRPMISAKFSWGKFLTSTYVGAVPNQLNKPQQRSVGGLTWQFVSPTSSCSQGADLRMIKEKPLISHERVQQYENKAAGVLHEGLFLSRASCRRRLGYRYNLGLCSLLLVETKIPVRSFSRDSLSYMVAESYKSPERPIHFGLVICTTSVKYIFLAPEPFENFLTEPAFSIFFAL